jgi:predicted secreted protein
MEISINPKCGKCKCYWIPDDTDIKSSGLHYKCCKKCRDIVKKSRIKQSQKWYNIRSC